MFCSPSSIKNFFLSHITTHGKHLKFLIFHYGVGVEAPSSRWECIVAVSDMAECRKGKQNEQQTVVRFQNWKQLLSRVDAEVQIYWKSIEILKTIETVIFLIVFKKCLFNFKPLRMSRWLIYDKMHLQVAWSELLLKLFSFHFGYFWVKCLTKNQVLIKTSTIHFHTPEKGKFKTFLFYFSAAIFSRAQWKFKKLILMLKQYPKWKGIVCKKNLN